MPLCSLLFLVLGVLGLAHAKIDPTIEFQNDLRAHFNARLGNREHRSDQLLHFDFTKVVPPHDQVTTALIKASPDRFLELGFALVRADVVCRVGLGLGYASRFEMYGPESQVVKAYCLRIAKQNQIGSDLVASYAAQSAELSALDMRPAEIAEAFNTLFSEYEITKIAIARDPIVRVAQAHLFVRGGHNPADLRVAGPWYASQVGNVDLTVRPRGQTTGVESKNMGYTTPLANCEDYFVHPVPMRTRVESGPMATLD